MRRLCLVVICSSLLATGCADTSSQASRNGSNTDPALSDPALADEGSEAGESEILDEDDADLHRVTLSPENTTIQFVGTHVTEEGPDPNARTGVFTKFTGYAGIDPTSGSLKSVVVEIQTSSLQTPIERLNGHLRSQDFFDAQEYPTARFESTKIEPASGDEGTHTITGNLTLLKTTNEISFPATIEAGSGDLSLESTFVIDRTEFGMTWGPERVNREVEMTVSVGKKTELPQTAGG